MSGKYTQGEWVKNQKNGRVIECNGVKIATAERRVSNPPEAWANADLMVTSPELLSILETIIKQLGSPCGTVCSDTYDEARAIVKKAKGQG